MSGDGEQKLFLIGSVMNGELSVELAVNQVHVLKLFAKGYQDQEVALRKAGIQKSQTKMRRQIKLVPKEVSTAVEEAIPDGSPTDSLSQADNPQPEDLSGEDPEEVKDPLREPDSNEVTPETSTAELVENLQIFRLSRSTSLRRAATHNSGIILRLKEGNQVEVLEKTNNSWWMVKFGEEIGFAKAALMEEL